jgi:hypothetical protein
VDAQRGAGRGEDVGDDIGHLVGQHAAVGVAEGHHLGARLHGGPDRLERVRPVEAVAVEEVLGIEEDPARPPARRVAPKAARVALRSRRSVCARAKNSVSLGFAPGQPPSM